MSQTRPRRGLAPDVKTAALAAARRAGLPGGASVQPPGAALGQAQKQVSKQAPSVATSVAPNVVPDLASRLASERLPPQTPDPSVAQRQTFSAPSSRAADAGAGQTARSPLGRASAEEEAPVDGSARGRISGAEGGLAPADLAAVGPVPAASGDLSDRGTRLGGGPSSGPISGPTSGCPAASDSRPRGVHRLEDWQQMQAIDRATRALGLASPYFRLHEGRAEARSRIAGQECLNFASYDYLGLNADPRPRAAAGAALERYGLSASGSRMVSGSRPAHVALEAALARHYGCEAALSFVSGHATNVSLIATLMGEGDLILSDAYVHNSITTGAALSGAARRSFAHNDLAALARILENARPLHRHVLIVVEGLYSMDGDLPDLPGLLALRDRYDAWLMVDEAHALGPVGATGRGIFEHFGVDPGAVDIWMGTLSKTLAATGGYVAGSGDLIRLLAHRAPGHVFSVALPPVLAAGAAAALALMAEEPWRVKKLQANGAHFLARARALGLDPGGGQGYGVLPVMVGDSVLAARLSERLLARGVNVAPVTFPGVPMGAARLRFFLSADHEPAQIDEALGLCAEELAALRDDGLGRLFSGAAPRPTASGDSP
ncbi:aminotransferase class I/II-fold pyridoxal phosphate-dependent enzyme [Pseudooceanicola sp. 200-1SW]|uniref:aminotransferase class I/II-fold pyridoxal phosphate-dependent enzyme n=1 Tax=Pseudooceanicola sp. 200-1SW TaxID=3425949 RepID=UPI003D7F19AE